MITWSKCCQIWMQWCRPMTHLTGQTRELQHSVARFQQQNLTFSQRFQTNCWCYWIYAMKHIKMTTIQQQANITRVITRGISVHKPTVQRAVVNKDSQVIDVRKSCQMAVHHPQIGRYRLELHICHCVSQLMLIDRQIAVGLGKLCRLNKETGILEECTQWIFNYISIGIEYNIVFQKNDSKNRFNKCWPMNESNRSSQWIRLTGSQK